MGLPYSFQKNGRPIFLQFLPLLPISSLPTFLRCFHPYPPFPNFFHTSFLPFPSSVPACIFFSYTNSLPVPVPRFPYLSQFSTCLGPYIKLEVSPVNVWSELAKSQLKSNLVHCTHKADSSFDELREKPFNTCGVIDEIFTARCYA